MSVECPHVVTFRIDAPKDPSHDQAAQSRCLRSAARKFREATGLADCDVVCVVGRAQRLPGPQRDVLEFSFAFGPNLLLVGGPYQSPHTREADQAVTESSRQGENA